MLETDVDVLDRHTQVWRARPELRSVYADFFRSLLDATGERRPLVEIGSGPGFFKQYCPHVLSTDVLAAEAVDVVCDACALPFREESVGAFVLVDVLHHLARPLDFMNGAARVLVPGGRLAMIEPWVTPASYLLYRCFHHEECRLSIDVTRPFGAGAKKAFDGNATIPLKVVQYYEANPAPLRLIRREPFLALPYLSTLGFQRATPLPGSVITFSRWMESGLGPLGRWNATRALLVWEKTASDPIRRWDGARRPTGHD